MESTQAMLSKHSPEILIGLGIAGMISTAVLAVTATPKALKAIEEKKEEEQVEELTTIETVKTTWKYYVPAVASGIFSACCVVGAHSVNARRNAALAAAYKISETALTEYREKVMETVGEKKEKTIREKVQQKRIDEKPVSKSNVIVTSKGHTRCYEYYNDRYFWSDIEQIKRVVNDLNKRMLSEGYISLSDFYDELELNHTSISDHVGWNIDDGFIDIDFSAHLGDDGEPCIAIEYRNPPKYDFSKFY